MLYNINDFEHQYTCHCIAICGILNGKMHDIAKALKYNLF